MNILKKHTKIPLPLALIATSLLSTAAYSQTYFVDPDGNDLSTGAAISSPLATIERALRLAKAGDTIHLMDGEYLQNIDTYRGGTPANPIRITGSPSAIVKGTERTNIAFIRHNYIELNGFTIDGLVGDGSQVLHYRKKLVYILGKKNVGIHGVKLLNMELLNARDECIRFKYFARNNEISNSHISHCGAEDFLFDGGGHNGEGIYIGTAPEQLDRNATNEADQSDSNWIHDNIIETFGNECVDIKESSRFNIIEYNECSQQLDTNAAGISIRGTHNTVRFNTIHDNLGAGVRLGGDRASDGHSNNVYGNLLSNNEYSGLKIVVEPQDKICDNTFDLLEDQAPVRTASGIDKEQFLVSCP
ncbi:MAG: DUF1565 domain-containing protein [Methyloprofundus sp.]|nr:DUF1565 domain-containing protein [Methyloprofundus sp.]